MSTDSFYTVIFRGSTNTTIYNDDHGNPLNQKYVGFLYYIMGPGAKAGSINGNNVNGGSGYVKTGYVDFLYPKDNFNNTNNFYTINMTSSKGLNINISNSSSYINFLYTNDPSNTGYPANSFSIGVPYTITPGSVTIKVENPSTSYSATGFSDIGHFLGGNPSSNVGVTDQRNFLTSSNNYNSEGNVISGSSGKNTAGGFYGQNSVAGPFGYGSGSTNSSATSGFIVLTFIPKSSVTNYNDPIYTTSLFTRDGAYPNLWNSIGQSGTFNGTNGLYLFGMFGGGGGGGLITNQYSGNYGGGGGGSGIEGFGMINILNSSLNINTYAAAGGFSTTKGDSDENIYNGFDGEPSSITFNNQTTFLVLGGNGGLGNSPQGGSTSGTGGDGAYGGGGGAGGGGGSGSNSSNGGNSLIKIGGNFIGNPSSGSSTAGNGAGSVNSNCFGVGTYAGSSTVSFGSGGGGGYWGGVGTSGGANTKNNSTASAYGYGSGGGGGGYNGGHTYNAGAGSGGYVLCYGISSSNCLLYKLTTGTNLQLSQFMRYKGVWIWTELQYIGENNQPMNVCMNDLNTLHFFIKEDGVYTLVCNSDSSITVNFLPINIGGTITNQSLNYPQINSYSIAYNNLLNNSSVIPNATTVNLTGSIYWNLFFYK